jgi:adenosylcobinamide-GDP ribazoletransferase
MDAPPPARLTDGLRLAITTFTVAPVRTGAVDRRAAGIAMTAAPAVGLILGALIGALALAGRAVHAPALLTGLVCVAALALATRGLHLDGLADAVDGLGSYRPAARALEIMKSPEVGPFGVVALVLAVTVPAAAIAGILDRPWWAVIGSVAAAIATGRTAATWACRRGVPAAAPDGLGALVAGTVGVPAAALGLVLAAAPALAAVPDRPWQGPIAVLAGLGATLLLVRHATRRLGGITGDVLGACVEVAAAVAFIGVAV